MLDILKKLEDDEHYYGKFGQQYLSNSDIIHYLMILKVLDNQRI